MLTLLLPKDGKYRISRLKTLEAVCGNYVGGVEGGGMGEKQSIEHNSVDDSETTSNLEWNYLPVVTWNYKTRNRHPLLQQN